MFIAVVQLKTSYFLRVIDIKQCNVLVLCILHDLNEMVTLIASLVTTPQCYLADQSMIEQFLAIEYKMSAKLLPPEQQRQPVRVILPHLAVRNLVDISPNRRRLGSLAKLPFATTSSKHRHMQLVAIQELKV